MKKFAKMSLVAAIAVAGLTNVNAASLEEAIKGVDVSGQFRFRFNEKNTEAGAHDTDSDVEIELTAKVPVNDMVTAVMKFDTTRNVGDTEGSDNTDFIDVEDYYFQYQNGPVTVMAGQQNIPGRMTDGHQGDGLVALYNMGAFTVGAAAFANHSVDLTVDSLNYTVAGNDDMLLSVIAMGSVGPVSLLGQYANVSDTTDSYNLKADATVGPVMFGLEYTASELDSATGVAKNLRDDRDTFKAYVSGSMGIVSAKLAYAKTGDNGSGSIDNLTSENDNVNEIETPSELLVWNLGTAGKSDMDVIVLDASVAVTDSISIRAAYADGEVGNAKGNEVEEILGQVTYKMSPNLTTYVRYSQFDANATDNVDDERARVEVKYTF